MNSQTEEEFTDKMNEFTDGAVRPRDWLITRQKRALKVINTKTVEAPMDLQESQCFLIFYL